MFLSITVRQIVRGYECSIGKRAVVEYLHNGKENPDSSFSSQLPEYYVKCKTRHAQNQQYNTVYKNMDLCPLGVGRRGELS